jgi:hypothetical protein
MQTQSESVTCSSSTFVSFVGIRTLAVVHIDINRQRPCSYRVLATSIIFLNCSILAAPTLARVPTIHHVGPFDLLVLILQQRLHPMPSLGPSSCCNHTAIDGVCGGPRRRRQVRQGRRQSNQLVASPALNVPTRQWVCHVGKMPLDHRYYRYFCNAGRQHGR